MYAIIREGEGKYYTSIVFGYYKTADKYDFTNRYWIILNKEKTKLIKQCVMQQNTKYLIPVVLVTDADKSNWRKISEHEESVAFLPTDRLLSLIDKDAVPEALTQKCIEMDRAYLFEPLKQIKTPNDIRDLEWASGGFHDAYISKIQEGNDSVYVLFAGTWGCNIEVWFDGEVAYNISEQDDPYWFSSTVTIHDGFVYLIDDENVPVEDIHAGYCWFKARNMRYRVIPD